MCVYDNIIIYVCIDKIIMYVFKQQNHYGYVCLII